jgi:hypothetical protein
MAKDNGESCDIIATFCFLMFGLTILTVDYKRDDEMQLERITSTECDIKSCFLRMISPPPQRWATTTIIMKDQNPVLTNKHTGIISTIY